VPKNQRVLVISDMHIPYGHPDTLLFLTAIKESFKPDRIICIGDELDYHAISFHAHDPDILSPSDELKLATQKIGYLYNLFPIVDALESNHGSLVYRKGKFAGLPRTVFKSYHDVLQAPKEWRWHLDLTIELSNGQQCYFHHGMSSQVAKLTRNKSMNAVQGHYHSKFEITYWGNSKGLYWGMNVGCLIDDKSLAFAYNKNTLERPIIGTGMIIDGHPRLIPMVLGTNGRWIKRLV
jgi:predicted phosphodiesterase